MPADSEMASLYALRYSAAQITTFLDAALTATRDGVDMNISFEGASMATSAEKARQLAMDLGAALKLKQASDDDGDSNLNESPWTTGVDLSSRRIE